MERLRIVSLSMIRTGGLDAISGEVVVGRHGGVQREAGTHAAQPRLVVAKCREVVFVRAHRRTFGPEKVFGELVVDEAGGEVMAVSGAASEAGADSNSKLLRVFLTTNQELTRVLHLVTAHIRLQELSNIGRRGFLAILGPGLDTVD